jgi:hypothetical protein
MHSILWASILASAGVALVTTLLVEYLAKPSLEARKDRILEDRRQQRDALKSLDRCVFLAGGLHLSYRMKRSKLAASHPELANVLSGDTEITVAEIGKLIASAHEAIEVPAWVYEEWTAAAGMIMSFSTVLRAEGQPGQDTWKDFYCAVYQTEDFLKLLTTSKWHLRRRYKLMKKIKSSPTAVLNSEMREAIKQKYGLLP